MILKLQVRALERRFNRNKFIIATFKNFILVGLTIAPSFLNEVENIPVSAIGYIGYLTKLLFEFVENDELRKQVHSHKQQVEGLMKWYLDRGDEISFSNSNTRIQNTQRSFCNPLETSENMFGYYVARENSHTRHGAFDFTTLIPWVTVIQFMLVSTVFSLSIAHQLITPDDNCLTNPYVLPILIIGAVSALIDPIEEHLKKGNLIRARDTLLDVIYAVTTRIGRRNEEGQIEAFHPKKFKRVSQVFTGVAGIFRKSHSNQTVDVKVGDDQPTRFLSVPIKRYIRDDDSYITQIALERGP